MNFYSEMKLYTGDSLDQAFLEKGNMYDRY